MVDKLYLYTVSIHIHALPSSRAFNLRYIIKYLTKLKLSDEVILKTIKTILLLTIRKLHKIKG